MLNCQLHAFQSRFSEVSTRYSGPGLEIVLVICQKGIQRMNGENTASETKVTENCRTLSVRCKAIEKVPSHMQQQSCSAAAVAVVLLLMRILIMRLSNS